MSKCVMMDDRYMIEPEVVSGALDAICSVDVKTYQSLRSVADSRVFGVSGQSLKAVLPHTVEVDGMGVHYVYLDQLVPVLVAAVKELSEKVRQLEAKPARRTRIPDVTVTKTE